MTEKKPTLLATLKKMTGDTDWTWTEFYESMFAAYVYTPCMDEDGDPMPITFRSRPGEPGYHYLFTSPKLLRESVPDAPEHGRDRGADIFPLMAQSGCGIAFNPGTPTYLNLTPEMLQEMAGAK